MSCSILNIFAVAYIGTVVREKSLRQESRKSYAIPDTLMGSGDNKITRVCFDLYWGQFLVFLKHCSFSAIVIRESVLC